VATDSRLLADIGATRARFALLQADGDIVQTKTLDVAAHDQFSGAIEAYLASLEGGSKPKEAALAIAAPITGDAVTMLNAPWRFSLAGIKRQFGWTAIHAVNDFAANALAVPHLSPGDLAPVGEGASLANAAVAVLGPGTGLGVAALVPTDGGFAALSGEGGHATLAAFDSREAAIIDILRRQYAHVSAERVLSGPGLVNLYDSLCELAGKPAGPLNPEHITNLYPGCDPQCREAVALFCAMLGTFAGSVALTYGARGGVYIMGGIVPKIFEFFRHSAFRERFEFKGRYRAYLAGVPTYVVMHPTPALLGLKTLFRN
jgi:glucokinase